MVTVQVSGQLQLAIKELQQNGWEAVKETLSKFGVTAVESKAVMAQSSTAVSKADVAPQNYWQ